jgi:hypothetical protein
MRNRWLCSWSGTEESVKNTLKNFFDDTDRRDIEMVSFDAGDALSVAGDVERAKCYDIVMGDA